MANWPEHNRGGGRGREETGQGRHMQAGRQGRKLFVFASYYARGEDIHSHAEVRRPSCYIARDEAKANF